MKRMFMLLATVGLVVTSVTACGSSDDDGSGVVTKTVHVDPTTSSSTRTTTTSASTSTSTSVEKRGPLGRTAIMPDVMCMNLQEAQNKIQKAGVFFSRSQDGTGKARRQLYDRNWLVVLQHPEPGATVTEGEAVLTVVKYGEPNNC
ncbi:MAG: hypothetical protein QM658_05270 [Gordonia sp. (in: high G+C Gram-positive bacteria)]